MRRIGQKAIGWLADFRHEIFFCLLLLAVVIPIRNVFTEPTKLLASKDAKLRRTWGDLYDFGCFITERTPPDASILLPSTGLGPHLSNPSLLAYFLLPRRLIIGDQNDMEKLDLHYVVRAENAPAFPVEGTTEWFHKGRGIVLSPDDESTFHLQIDDVEIQTGSDLVFQHDYDHGDQPKSLSSDYITRANRTVVYHGRDWFGCRSGACESLEIRYRNYTEVDLRRLGLFGEAIWITPSDSNRTSFSLWEKSEGGQIEVALSLQVSGVGLVNIAANRDQSSDGWTRHSIDDVSEALRTQRPEIAGGRVATIQLLLLSDIRTYPYYDWGLITSSVARD